jgi:hypothetical protein
MAQGITQGASRGMGEVYTPEFKPSKRRQFANKQVQVSKTRVEQITPLLWQEIQQYFGPDDIFTRDHLIYCNCLRQFSMAYRIALVRFAVKALMRTNKVLKFNVSDLGLYTPENVQRKRIMQRNKETVFAGSYVTRAADELLNRTLDANKAFDPQWLAEWLHCLQKLGPTTRFQYAQRISKDLTRRGVLKDVGGGLYTVAYF